MITVPKRLKRQLKRLRRMFGIEDWTITLALTDKPGGGSQEGHTSITARYYAATVEIHNGLDDADTREILLHEYLHVAFGQIDLAFEQVKHLIPEEHRDLAERLYTDAQEQTIMRMAAGLVDTLLPAKETKE